MAKKPRTADPFDDLAAGIEPEVEQPEEPPIKIIEPPPPAKRHGIVVEDLDVPAITGAAPSHVPPPEPDEQNPDMSHMSASARERTLAEMKLGRENLKKLKAGG